MNIKELVCEYVENCAIDEPIFIEDIKEAILKKVGDSDKNDNILKNVNVVLNRLKEDGNIKTPYKGVYYKPAISVFGEVPLNTNRLIERKYIKDKNENVKGYVTGAKLFNKLGLTTQVPNITEIVTNECKYHKQYDEKLRTYIIKPRIKITNENYLYLQFIDILENREKINIEVENSDDILYRYINEFKLSFEKIIKYARETNKPKVLNRLYLLAR